MKTIDFGFGSLFRRHVYAGTGVNDYAESKILEAAGRLWPNRFSLRLRGTLGQPTACRKLHVLLNRRAYDFGCGVVNKKKKIERREQRAKGVRKYITSPAETSITLKIIIKKGLRPAKES